MNETKQAYNEELYTRFFAIVGSPEDGKKISQNKAAKALGCSSGYISAYKSRTYPASIKTLEDKIEAWLKREEQRLGRVYIPVTEISAVSQVRKAASMAQNDADIAVVVGAAGAGKTTALRQYASESKSAYLIEVDASFTKSVLISEIAQAVGVELKGGNPAIIKRIITTLKDRDAVLIIDEADYLSDASLELVRRIIADKAQTGVVFAGLPRLEYKLRNLRNDHEQLTSRVGALVEIGKMKRNDASKILANVWPELEKETFEELFNLSNGSVRTLTKLINRTHQIMGLNRIDLPDVETVQAASEYLMR